MSQATLMLFDFLLFPVLGRNTKVWKNLPDVEGKEDAIAELMKAPQKVPKPIYLIRDGDGKMLTMPRVNLPEKLTVIDAENPVDEWLKKASDFIDGVIDMPMSTAWQAACLEFPELPKRRTDDNEFFVAFREELSQRKDRA